MENILRPIYQEWASQTSTQGIILMKNRKHYGTITDLFDAVLLIITNDESEVTWQVRNYNYEEYKFSLYIVNDKQIHEWIVQGSNRKIFDWLFNGKVMFDRNDYLHHLINELHDFPFHERKLRIGIEFAKLIRRYIDGKALYEQGQFFDAYNHIVHSLHHLGRLAVIEKGYHPEITVWNQVKQIEPEVYKMYQELIVSEESLPKRLELLFLASEFFIHKKTELGSAHLIKVLEEKEVWPIQEIMKHQELKLYSVDLVVLIEYLVEKNFIKTIAKETKGEKVYHRYYKVKR